VPAAPGEVTVLVGVAALGHGVGVRAAVGDAETAGVGVGEVVAAGDGEVPCVGAAATLAVRAL
jgi:hypothetical protein